MEEKCSGDKTNFIASVLSTVRTVVENNLLAQNEMCYLEGQPEKSP